MTDTPPDWIQNTPSTSAIHNEPTDSQGSLTLPFTPAKLAQIGFQLVEGFLSKVVAAIVGVFIPGGGTAFSQLSNWSTVLLPAQILAPINQLLTLLISVLGFIPGAGTTIQKFAQVFGFLKDTTTTAQTTANTANTKSDNIIDALVSGLTGQSSTGNDVSNIGLALVNGVVSFPLDFAEAILALFAGQQAQITAIQNNPGGPSQTDDFTTATLSGRTNVVGAGTMAISTRGPYLQTTAFAADYMGTTGTPRKPATHKCGTSITVEPNMQGVCRAWICGDNAMTNYAAVEVYSGFDGDVARIVTGSSPSLTVVRNQADIAKLAASTVFDIKYDPTANVFTVLRNRQDIGLSWPDTTNVVTHTSGKTFVGAVENADDVNEDGFYGPGIRMQTFYDW